MTNEELQAALATEREARIRAEATLQGYRMAVAEMRSGGTPVDSVAERRREYDRNRKRKGSEIPVDSGGIPADVTPPTPPLDGSPLPPAPSLPSPLSSPHPLFLSAPPEASPQPAAETLTLALRNLPAPEEAAEKPSRRKPPAVKREPTGDPRHAPLVAALVEAHRGPKGAPYGFAGGRDAKAVTELLALADQNPETAGDKAPAEILRRWEIALGWVGFPACTGLTAFRDNWNAYARIQALRPASVMRGSVRAETANHSKTGDLDL